MTCSRALGATGLVAASLLFLASPVPALAHHSFMARLARPNDPAAQRVWLDQSRR
jgi:hypothetical protein